MRSFLRKYWFKLGVILAIAVPAIITQTEKPIIGFVGWEIVADKIYSTLLSNQTPASKQPSSVVIVEVEQRTIARYGWPIGREQYAQFFEKTKAMGHPYVLSMISFQALHKSGAFKDEKIKQSEDALAEDIKQYGRVIGTNLFEQKDQELTNWQEDELMPRVALSKAQVPPEELPYLPMYFNEDDMFLDTQIAFGFGSRRGNASVSYCSQMYITDSEFAGAFVIPSSFVWATAYASGRSFTTTTGAAWPRLNEEAPVSTENPIQVGFRHCVSSPQMFTSDFFSDRHLETISMVDIIDGVYQGSLDGKLVILASESSSGFPGPGRPIPGGESVAQDNKVKEYQFAARLIDDMLTGKSIRRESLGTIPEFSIAPIVAASFLILVSFFTLTRLLILVSASMLFGSLIWSGYFLYEGVFSIPVQLIVYTLTVTTFLIALDVYLRFYGFAREIRFSSSLRRELAQCNTIFEIEKITQTICSREFISCALKLENFDRGLYVAAANPQSAMEYINMTLRADDSLSQKDSTQIKKLPAKKGLKNIIKQEKGYEVNLNITSKEIYLGSTVVKVTYLPHEQQFIRRLLEALRLELGQHWNRIKLLVDQKILDYKVLMEQTRSDILARFLTQSIVNKFSNKMTMQENLSLVLTPRPTKAALMQADIRGYSRISATLEPREMVQMLQNYYKNVVDIAQIVAQVKLIGDCIFLFIEESSAGPDLSPVDMCAEIASLLVNETNLQNKIRVERNEEPMFFGIAIHYGDVVVGNLSSDSCIDYTVIGPNVNMVARLEEMTKLQPIAENIGKNGTILSEAAYAALKKHSLPQATKLNLPSLKVSVRSFANVVDVYGVTSEQILKVKPSLFGKIS